MLTRNRTAFWLVVACMLGSSLTQAQVFVGMPDLKQQGFGGVLPQYGYAYCGPTAAANVLLWMDDHRMQEVFDGKGHSEKVSKRMRTFNKREAGQLVRTLGKYMDTDSHEGTPPEQLVKGLDRYLRDHGKTDFRVRYQGLRPVERRYLERKGPPSIHELRRSVEQGKFALLNLGWYKRHGDTLVRIGGHWVTFTGWQKAGNYRHLVVHDPANRPYWQPSNILLRLQPLGDGKLIDRKDGWAIPARGFNRLLGPIARAPGSEYAILEGAVFIESGQQKEVAYR